jgi:hypothetical protein
MLGLCHTQLYKFIVTGNIVHYFFFFQDNIWPLLNPVLLSSETRYLPGFTKKKTWLPGFILPSFFPKVQSYFYFTRVQEKLGCQHYQQPIIKSNATIILRPEQQQATYVRNFASAAHITVNDPSGNRSVKFP